MRWIMRPEFPLYLQGAGFAAIGAWSVVEGMYGFGIIGLIGIGECVLAFYFGKEN